MPRVEDQHEKSVKVKCSVPNGLGKLTLISKGDACKGVGRSKRPPKVKKVKKFIYYHRLGESITYPWHM